MASGSFNVGTSNGYISGKVNWSSTTDVANNRSKVYVEMRLSRTNSGYTTWGSGYFAINVNGTLVDTNTSFTLTHNSNTLVVSGEVWVGHNTDGTKSITISWDGNTNVFDVNWGSGTANLDRIPRASDITSGISWTAGVQSLSVVTNRASSSFHHDLELQVQKPDGTWAWILNRNWWYDSTTINFSVDENTRLYQALAGHEQRPAKILLKTWENHTFIGEKHFTGTVYGATPATITFDDFTIGDNVPARMWNMQNINGFEYTARLTFGQLTKEWIIDKSNVFPTITFTSAEIDKMYASIPNANVGIGNVYISSKYNGVELNDGIPVNQNKGFKAYVDVASNSPTFNSNYTYADTNTITSTLTGNNQYIIQDKSTVRVTIPVAQRALPKNHATMVRYEATLNGVTKTANWSNTADVVFDFGTVNASNNISLVVVAVDSRGNRTEASKTVVMIPYKVPQIVSSTKRKNNFENDTTITASGTFSIVNVGGTSKNRISSVRYRYKQTPNGAWSDYLSMGTVTQNTTTGTFSVPNKTINLDNTQAWDIEINVTDKLGSTYVIKSVNAGKPLFFIDADKESVSVGKLPSGTGTFETAGDALIGGNLTLMDGAMKPLTISANGKAINVSGIDLNDLIETGIYMADETSANRPPVPAWVYIEVIKHNDLFVSQKAIDFWSSNVFQRNLINGVWYAWKQYSTIESSGSNANGNYVRYTDGLQICWHNQYFSSTRGMWNTAVSYSFGYYMYMGGNWTFPISFSSPPATFASGDINGSMSETHLAFNPNNSSCNVESGTLNSGGTDIASPPLWRTLLAVGRWK